MSGLDVDGNPKNNYDNPGFGPKDLVLASFACDGTYRWSKVFGGSGGEIINSVVVDSQDNVYVGGSMTSCHPYPGTPSEPYPSQIDTEYFFSNSSSACTLLFFAKFNKNGVLQFVKRPQLPTTISNAYSSLSFNFQIQNDVIYWYLWLPPGSYADGAFTNSNSDLYTPYVLKYNLDGTFISATQLGTIQTNSSYDIKYYRNPHNGHYYTTITKSSSGTTISINGQPIVKSAALLCYDNNGTFLWKRENTGNFAGTLRFSGLDFDSLNNIYIGGKLTGLNLDSFLGFSHNLPASPAFVMKTNPTATTSLWASNHNAVDALGGAILYNNTELVYTGMCAGTGSIFTWGTQSIPAPGANQGYDVLLARFNSTTGACMNLNKINSNTPSTDFGAAIVKDASGDYVIGGAFGGTLYDVNNNTVVNEGGDSDFFITKFSTQACLPLSSESFEKSKTNIYPNPVQNAFTVPVKENTNYQLYTITGVLVKEGSVNTIENIISISNLPAGCYLLQLQLENGKRESVKVIKE